MTARSLNPNLPPFPFTSAPRPVFAWAVVLASGAAFSGGIVIFSRLLERSDGLHPVALAAAAAGGAISWFILSPAGLAGELRSWKPEPPLGQGSGRLAAGAWGACFGLLAGIAAWDAQRTFDFLFSWVLQVGFPSFNMSFASNLACLSLPLAICGVLFVGFGLTPAWAGDGSSIAARLRRAIFPAALLAAAAAWVLNLHSVAVRVNGWRTGNLAQAASLPDRTTPIWTFVNLGADGGSEPAVTPWPAETLAVGRHSSSVVAATDANTRRLSSFLEGRGRYSRFFTHAVNALPKMHGALWDREATIETIEILNDLFGEDILFHSTERTWLNTSAPITAANRARLERLTDPAHYRLQGRSARNAAMGWQRFGDPARARHLLAVARLSNGEVKKEDYALIGTEPFSAGSVQGRVSMDGKPAAGARVGLFRLYGKNPSLKTLPDPHYTLFPGLADSRSLGPDGAFRFQSLSDGAYGLCILLPPGTVPTKGKLKAGKLPGVFTLSRRAPSADFGTISLARKER